MERIIEFFLRLLNKDGFYEFQSKLAMVMYSALSEGYRTGKNEIGLVEGLENAPKGKSYGGVQIHAKKIHGKTSWVEFQYRDETATKELADIVVISLVTRGRERLIQRVCIIQNKKENKQSQKKGTRVSAWTIDKKQLFLLKNFPPFSSTKGIFKGMTSVLFRNNSQCLGTYGLFNSPGEMTLLSARLVSELLKGRSQINSKDISILPGISQNFSILATFGWPMFPDPHFWHEIYHRRMEYYRYSISPLPTVPFLCNKFFCRDIYDFARDLTLMNLGETCFQLGEVLSAQLDFFSCGLMRRLGLDKSVDLGEGYIEEPEEGVGVIVIRADTGEIPE